METWEEKEVDAEGRTMDNWTDDDGDKWISCDPLTVGDYGGAGVVGEANARALEAEYPNSHTERGDYNHRQFWLPDTADTRKIVEGLERNYPVYDEDMLSHVEEEWEREAWEDWLRSDLLATLPDALQELVEDMDDITLWEWYQTAMEAANEYPVFEYSGACVRVERIAGQFYDQALTHFWDDVEAVLPPTMFDLANDWAPASDWLEDAGRADLATFLRWVNEPVAAE